MCVEGVKCVSNVSSVCQVGVESVKHVSSESNLCEVFQVCVECFKCV